MVNLLNWSVEHWPRIALGSLLLGIIGAVAYEMERGQIDLRISAGRPGQSSGLFSPRVNSSDAQRLRRRGLFVTRQDDPAVYWAIVLVQCFVAAFLARLMTSVP